MLRRESVIDIDRQISRLGELHAELAMGSRAAADPSAAVQIHHDRMGALTLRHSDVRSQTRPKFDGFVKCANLGGF